MNRADVFALILIIDALAVAAYMWTRPTPIVGGIGRFRRERPSADPTTHLNMRAKGANFGAFRTQVPIEGGIGRFRRLRVGPAPRI